MVTQVLLRDLTFGYREVGNYPTPYVLKILPDPWLLIFSYDQDHQRMVLASSRFNMRSATWKAGRDTTLWQYFPIGNLKKFKHPRRRSHARQQYISSVMTMYCDTPKDFIKSCTGGIHIITHSPLDLLIPLARKKYLSVIPLHKI